MSQLWMCSYSVLCCECLELQAGENPSAVQVGKQGDNVSASTSSSSSSSDSGSSSSGNFILLFSWIPGCV